MAESIEVFRYISYLQKRWRWIASSCAIALVIAFAATMAMPRAFTATARIVVEPPAGADLRSAMAVSPVYLESLKTYEHFASSDSVFPQRGGLSRAARSRSADADRVAEEARAEGRDRAQHSHPRNLRHHAGSRARHRPWRI
jgi:hypothetical protein